MCSSYNLLHPLFFFLLFFLISSCIVFGRLPKHVVVAQFSDIDQTGRELWGGGGSQQNKEHVQTSRPDSSVGQTNRDSQGAHGEG